MDGAATALRGLDDLLDEDGYLVVATIWPWNWTPTSLRWAPGGARATRPGWPGMLARLDEARAV